VPISPAAAHSAAGIGATAVLTSGWPDLRCSGASPVPGPVRRRPVDSTRQLTERGVGWHSDSRASI
jgi:hypothetical protein